MNNHTLNHSSVGRSNASTNATNFLNQKINGHGPDVKSDAKLEDDKRTDLNGGVKGIKEEVNSKFGKLLGQRKTFNGGLEFMIECTEKE